MRKILLKIFSKITSCNQLIFCLIGRPCRPLILIGRHIILVRNCMVLDRHIIVLQKRIFFCLKARPCRHILIHWRYLLIINHLQIPMNDLIIYIYIYGQDNCIYLHLPITLQKTSDYYQVVWFFWSWCPALIS